MRMVNAEKPARRSAGKSAWAQAAGLAALSLLWACQAVPSLTPDAAELTAAAPGAPAAPDCASCHAYPLHDVLHQYHLVADNVLFHTMEKPQLNGAVTCMDCHFNSVRGFSHLRYDTLWVDAAGNEVEPTEPGARIGEISQMRVYRPTPPFAADTAQGASLAKAVDSLIRQYARAGKHVQWTSGRAHYDGKVDVAFPPNGIDPAGSAATAYRPLDLSCSSIACHNTPEATYRFADASRGLSHCPSLDRDDPTCGETAAPAAARSAP